MNFGFSIFGLSIARAEDREGNHEGKDFPVSPSYIVAGFGVSRRLRSGRRSAYRMGYLSSTDPAAGYPARAEALSDDRGCARTSCSTSRARTSPLSTVGAEWSGWKAGFRTAAAELLQLRVDASSLCRWHA
mgnify:CR=1 FL=1